MQEGEDEVGGCLCYLCCLYYLRYLCISVSTYGFRKCVRMFVPFIDMSLFFHYSFSKHRTDVTFRRLCS